MPTRFYCDLDGFQDNWIEVSDTWTRGEHKRVLAVTDLEPYFEMLRGKVTACHLQMPDGTILTKPEDLTEENFGEDMDLRLWGFVSGVLFRAVDNLRSLGNFAARLSSNGSEPTKSRAKQSS